METFTTATSELDLPERVRRRPYQYLLLAAGVGYVLGGGLFTGFTLRMLRLGARAAALPMVQRELLGVASAMLQAQPDSSS